MLCNTFYETYLLHCISSKSNGGIKKIIDIKRFASKYWFSQNYECKNGVKPQAIYFRVSREVVSVHTGVWYTQVLVMVWQTNIDQS